VTYLGSVVLEQEAALRSFKVTETFFRFLTKVFKRPYPAECLSLEGTLAMEHSLPLAALRHIYRPCMTEYFAMAFVDAAAVGSFTARALKLTRVLLEHFLEVP